MAEPARKDKSIVRYSDLARSSVNDQPNGVHDAPARDTDDIMFREATQLKSLARDNVPQSVNSELAVDHKGAQLFDQIVDEVTVIYNSVRGGQSFRLDRVFGLAQAVVDHPTPDRLVSRLFDSQPRCHYIDLNSAHSAILALQIARGLGYQREEQIQLMVAAMVHDIGMQTLPQELLNTPGQLSNEQLAIVQTHPEAGARLLATVAPQHPWLATIVREEHEREQGQGYPNGLHSDNIDELAKIVGMADVYDALVSPRPYRRIFSPHAAIQELLECQERLGYPKHVVRALIQQLSLFPIGCRVRLSSNEIGRVVQTNSQAPLRPVVEVLYDADGQSLRPPRHVDLNTNPLLHISASLSLEHVPSTSSEQNSRPVR